MIMWGGEGVKQKSSEELTNQSNMVFNFNSSLAKFALKTNQTHIF